MTQAVSRWPLVVRLWVPSQISPCENCSGQSGTVTGFPPSTSFSPVNIIAPLLHTHHLHVVLLSEGQRAKPGNSESNAVADFGGHLIEKCFSYFRKD